MLVVAIALASLGTAPIWPQPKHATNGSEVLTLTPSASFFVDANHADKGQLLHAAFERYARLSFPHSTTKVGTLATLKVSIDNADESHPQLDTDESYTLAVASSGASLTAKTVYGALRGLETFSQLVRFDFEDESYVIDGCPWSISDAPRFPHRGLMIDTARHFQPRNRR